MLRAMAAVGSEQPVYPAERMPQFPTHRAGQAPPYSFIDGYWACNLCSKNKNANEGHRESAGHIRNVQWYMGDGDQLALPMAASKAPPPPPPTMDPAAGDNLPGPPPPPPPPTMDPAAGDNLPGPPPHPRAAPPMQAPASGQNGQPPPSPDLMNILAELRNEVASLTARLQQWDSWWEEQQQEWEQWGWVIGHQ